MKGDFTRFLFIEGNRFSRSLRQQGRVDVEADSNEAFEILLQRIRTQAIDVIGRCGVPIHDDGFKIEPSGDGSDLTISKGRLYVDGLLCHNDDEMATLTTQADLPGYLPSLDDDGVYLVYLDAWERHLTHLEVPQIREVALGGPDTTTRTRTISQVRVHPLTDTEPFEDLDCRPPDTPESTGTMEARVDPVVDPDDPCVVPPDAGYRGLENRLYRVEIHDDGLDDDGVQVRTPTFKWSRDNGSVVLPVADGGVAVDQVTVRSLGKDDVLTVKVGHWVEVAGDETELFGRAGTLAQIEPDGIDRARRELTLSEDVSAHASEGHLKVRRWDHHETTDVALQDGAVPIQGDWYELEDGVQVRFDTAATYQIGNYWVVPARTRTGSIEWSKTGGVPDALPPHGIVHHYCTLALARRVDGEWTDVKDCRDLFPPLTEVGTGGCCVSVKPGEDVQQAIDTVVAAGGGCVKLCTGEHVVSHLNVHGAANLTIEGEGSASILRFEPISGTVSRGLHVRGSRAIEIRDLLLVSDLADALVRVGPNPDGEPSRHVALRRLDLLNMTPRGSVLIPTAVRLDDTDDVTIADCRMLAEVGCAAGAGWQSGDATDPADLVDAAHASFDDLDEGSEMVPGDELTSDDLHFTVGDWGVLDPPDNPRVEVVGETDGSGLELRLRGCVVIPSLVTPYQYGSVEIDFADVRGTVLRVNGALHYANDVDELNGLVLGGALVEWLPTPGANAGELRISAETQPLSDLAFGAFDGRFDNVTFRAPADAEPEQPRWGGPVRRVQLHRNQIRFLRAGVYAAYADTWRIDDCDFGALQREHGSFVTDVAMFNAGGGVAVETVDEIFALPPVVADGDCLWGSFFKDVSLSHNRLTALRGINVWWWLGGDAHHNTLTARQSGLDLGWTHRVDVSHNTVSAPEGVGVLLRGASFVHLGNNRIRATQGVVNGALHQMGSQLYIHLTAFRAVHATASATPALEDVLWWFLEQMVDSVHLRGVVEAAQQVLDEDAGDESVPVLRMLAAVLTPWLAKGGGASDNPIALPLLDLELDANEIATEAEGVRLTAFLPLGEIRLHGNSVSSMTSEGVRVDAQAYLANVDPLLALARVGFVKLLEMLEDAHDETDAADTATRELLAAIHDKVEQWQRGAEHVLSSDVRVTGNSIISYSHGVVSNVFGVAITNNHVTLRERSVPLVQTGGLNGVVTDGFNRPLPGVVVNFGNGYATTTNADGRYTMDAMPADEYMMEVYTPDGRSGVNEVRVEPGVSSSGDARVYDAEGLFGFDAGYSSGAALANRVYGSQPIRMMERERVAEALSDVDALQPMAMMFDDNSTPHAAREGGYVSVDHLIEGGNAAEVEAAFRAVSGATENAVLSGAAHRTAMAIDAGNATAASAALVDFVAALSTLADGAGILVTGGGARVVENQILVQTDADPTSFGLGGVQVNLALPLYIVTYLLSGALLKSLGMELDVFDPATALMGFRDTLILNNEIVGGLGNGVSLNAHPQLPELIYDVRIRGNEVRAMGGAGIFVGPQSFITGLTVDQNTVLDCCRLGVANAASAGIVVHTAAVGSVRSNEVIRTGARQTQQAFRGIEIEHALSLDIDQNRVVSNGSQANLADDGGIRIRDAYGDVSVSANEIAHNAGVALSWINTQLDEKDPLFPSTWLNAINSYLGMPEKTSALAPTARGRLENNAVRADGHKQVPLVWLLNLADVQFSGNSCQVESSSVPIGDLQQLAQAVISGNSLSTGGARTLSIKKLSRGAVVGNVGNQPIFVAVPHTHIEQGLNVPANV